MTLRRLGGSTWVGVQFGKDFHVMPEDDLIAHEPNRLRLRTRGLLRAAERLRRWSLVLLYETSNPVAPERQPVDDPGP